MEIINGITNNNLWTFKLEVNEIATSLENKTSTVKIQAYLGRASSQSYLGGNYKLSVVCAEQTQGYSGNIPYPTYINGGKWYLLKTFTFTVSNTGNPTTISISSSMSSSDFTPSSASASGSLTLTKLHDAPNITSFSLVEKNTQLTNLSVPNNTIVQYLSNKTATINVSTYDNATITNYSIYHNNILIGTSTTSTIAINFDNVGELINSGTGNVGLMVAVTDNLGGYSTKIFNFPVIKYTRPTIEFASTNIRRKTGNGTVLTDNIVLLNFVGTCYKGNDIIGNANKPTVQYKIWNTTEPSYSTLNTSNTANVTIKDYEISNIEYTDVYNYKINIYDVFTTIESTINLKLDKVPTGVSVWTEYKDRVDFLKLTILGINPFEYSTEEKIIGTWIDGKNLYRRTFLLEDVTLPANSDGTIYELTLMDLSNIDHIDLSKFHVKAGDTQDSIYITTIMQNTYFGDGNYFYIRGFFNNLLIQTNYWQYIHKGCVTVDYTKITD